MNRSKRTGTGYEVRLLEKLREIWPELDRAKANNPSNDFHGAPFPIEAKKRASIAVPDYVRKIRKVTDGHQWAIFFEDRDLRTKDSFGEIMIVDGDFGRELLAVWEEQRLLLTLNQRFTTR